MTKKNNGTGKIITGVLVLVILALLILIFMRYYNLSIGSRTSLSDAYHGQVDPINPEYLPNARIACAAYNGDWYDENTKVGCFDMGVVWDANSCYTVQVQTLRNLCESLQGADWVCDNHNVGCSY